MKLQPAKDADTILRGMLELFQGGRRWTRVSNARNRAGTERAVWDPDAHRFCLVGAAVRQFEPDTHLCRCPGWLEARGRLERAMGITGTLFDQIHDWNDKQESFGPVKAVLEAALEDGK